MSADSVQTYILASTTFEKDIEGVTYKATGLLNEEGLVGYLRLTAEHLSEEVAQGFPSVARSFACDFSPTPAEEVFVSLDYQRPRARGEYQAINHTVVHCTK